MDGLLRPATAFHTQETDGFIPSGHGLTVQMAPEADGS